MKRELTAAGLSAIILFTGCDSLTSSTEQSSPARYTALFPTSLKGDCWYFSDSAANKFTVDVIESIADNGTTYNNIRCTESKMATIQTSWLYATADTIYSAPKLQGTYAAFLPLNYNRVSSSFKSGTNKVTYTRIKGYTVGKNTYQEAISLKYTTAILNGFTEIVFVDGVGPVRFIDTRGRWPIQYDLDSAKIHGTTIK